jgi:hypothetical protein
MSNFALRIAQAHEDDTPAFYAYAYKDPALFAGDYPIGIPVAVAVPFRVATSATVWIPSLLWRYLDIDPYRVMWLFTFAQGLTIGLSIYVLAIVSVRSRTVAAIAVAFAYLATPWGWDPANYRGGADWTFVPYAAHLVIAPVLLGFASAILSRKGFALLFLAAAALIHPGLAVFACLILALYWLRDVVDSFSTDSLRWMLGLAAVAALAVGPAIVTQATLPDAPVPVAELMAGLRPNQHIWPWGYRGQWEFGLSTTIAWLALGALAWRCRNDFSRNVGRMWLASITAAFLLSVSHIAGAVFQIPMLLTLIGLRSWTWVALLSLPLVARYWVAHLESGHVVSAFVTLLCVGLPVLATQYALFWPLVVCLLLVDLSHGRLSAATFAVRRSQARLLVSLALAVLVVWSVALVLLPSIGGLVPAGASATWVALLWGYSPLPGRDSLANLLELAALGGLVAVGSGYIRDRVRARGTARSGRWPALASAFVVVYAACALGVGWHSAEAAGNPDSSDAMAVRVQLWARDHTPASAVFLAPVDGWRTLARRRMISPFTRESYAYIAPRGAKQWRDRLLAFYGISQAEGEAKRGNTVTLEERARFRRFREPDFLRFASEFGATHLVLPVCYPVTDQVRLDLPMPYSNTCFVVYSLGQAGP